MGWFAGFVVCLYVLVFCLFLLCLFYFPLSFFIFFFSFLCLLAWLFICPLFVCLQLHQRSSAPLEKYTAPKPLQSLSSNFLNLSWHIVKASLRQDHPFHLQTFPRKGFYTMEKTGMDGEGFFLRGGLAQNSTGRGRAGWGRGLNLRGRAGLGLGRSTYCIYQLIEIICYCRLQKNLTEEYPFLWTTPQFFIKNTPPSSLFHII